MLPTCSGKAKTEKLSIKMIDRVAESSYLEETNTKHP